MKLEYFLGRGIELFWGMLEQFFAASFIVVALLNVVIVYIVLSGG